VHSPNVLAARISVFGIFFIHGAVFSTWVSRIPAVQGALALSTGRLGFALLGVAAGSIVSMPLAGWLIARFGSRPVTAIASLWFCLALIPPAFAPSAAALGFSLALLGLGAGAMDVSMNAQGVLVERLALKPMMSGFHAAFSIGGMAGAAAGGAIARAGIGIRGHFLSAAILYFILIVLAIRGLVPAGAEARSHHHGFRLTPVIVGLGAICFCIFLSEGAMADWSALYLAHDLHAGPGEAAAGYAVFSFAMAVGRLAGDMLRGRFGSVPLVRNGSLLAASGLAMALLASSAGWALAGFSLVGFGCSIIVPISFAAAGNLAESTGGALATVVAAGYIGLFAGPPLIGMVAEAVTLPRALFIVVGMLLSGVVLARVVEQRLR
jgi:MFS family permease